MRIYGFSCQSCRHEFSALVEDDDEPAACPQCSSSKTLRDPVCRPAIRPTNRRRRVLDMSSGSCPCGCNRARA